MFGTELCVLRTFGGVDFSLVFICAQSVPEFLWDRLHASIQFPLIPKRAQYARFSGEFISTQYSAKNLVKSSGIPAFYAPLGLKLRWSAGGKAGWTTVAGNLRAPLVELTENYTGRERSSRNLSVRAGECIGIPHPSRRSVGQSSGLFDNRQPV